MCFLCEAKHSIWAGSQNSAGAGRRGFLLAAGGTAAAVATGVVPVVALAQVNVGPSSGLRKLVPAEDLENAATEQYAQLLSDARAQGALAPAGNPQLQRIRGIASRLIPNTAQWNDRARQWRWDVNLIGSKQINAFCMPGGKIAFYTGILDQLRLTDDEAAMTKPMPTWSAWNLPHARATTRRQPSVCGKKWPSQAAAPAVPAFCLPTRQARSAFSNCRPTCPRCRACTRARGKNPKNVSHLM